MTVATPAQRRAEAGHVAAARSGAAPELLHSAWPDGTFLDIERDAVPPCASASTQTLKP